MPFKFDGTSVESMFFVPPCRDRIGLSVSLLSYSDAVTITACSDDALGSVSQQLLQGFPKLFEDLAKELGVDDDSSL